MEQGSVYVKGCRMRFNIDVTRVCLWVLGDGIKDITKKYASEWLSSVKKIRVDESWWKNVLAPFQKADCERDVKEEAYVHGKDLASVGL